MKNIKTLLQMYIPSAKKKKLKNKNSPTLYMKEQNYMKQKQSLNEGFEGLA